MQIKYPKQILALFTVFLLLATARLAQAESLLPGGYKNDTGNYHLSDIVVLLIRVSDILLGVIGSIALVVFVAGGIMMLISSGRKEMVDKGKKTITGAIVGLLFVFFSWSIVEFTANTLGFDEEAFGKWYESPAGSDLIIGEGWEFDSGIELQVGDASPELVALLSCVKPHLPAGVGRISSISDSKNINNLAKCNNPNFCLVDECVHHCSSCHYGGGTNINESYAVDFGDEKNEDAIMAALTKCKWHIGDFSEHVVNEGDHIHVSVSKCPKL